MGSFLQLTLYCISILSLQQLLALPAGERPIRNRQDLLNKFITQEDVASLTSDGKTNSLAISPKPSPSQTLLPGFLRHPLASGVRTTSHGLAWAQPTEAFQIKWRAMRTRRHVHLRGSHHYPHHHAQLMRVGCVLGTCQVQNLSHRLYQLIGQSGREDTSPINPKSPHSYG